MISRPQTHSTWSLNVLFFILKGKWFLSTGSLQPGVVKGCFYRKKGQHVTFYQRQWVCFDYWTLYLVSAHTSSSARPPWGFTPSNTTGQLLRTRQGQWYLQVSIQAQDIPLGPHWQIVLVWPHERVGTAVIAYFPLIAFVTCGVCCYGARSEAFLSDVLNRTAELSPAPQEGEAHEEVYKEGNKLCSGTKHQQSSCRVGHRGNCQIETRRRYIKAFSREGLSDAV